MDVCSLLYYVRTMFCLADGCSWGESSRQAARKAATAYMDYLRENQRYITDIRYRNYNFIL